MFKFFNNIKNYFAEKALEDEKQRLREKSIFISGEAIYNLRVLESKALRCYGSSGFYNEDVRAHLSKIIDEHIESFLIRPLNYINDSDTTISSSSTQSIQERNDMMNMLIKLYLNHFKDKFSSMNKQERDKFFNKMKSVHHPLFLIDTISNFENNINSLKLRNLN